MKYGLFPKDVLLMKNVLKRFPEIQEGLLFGSRARGDYEKGSDIDIALKGAPDIHLTSKIKEALESLPLPYFFDVVDYDHLENRDLKKEIDQEGIIIS